MISVVLRFQSPEVEERSFVVLSLGRFFFFLFLFFFFLIKSLLCLKVQKTHAALAMEIKNL